MRDIGGIVNDICAYSTGRHEFESEAVWELATWFLRKSNEDKNQMIGIVSITPNYDPDDGFSFIIVLEEELPRVDEDGST